jgi:hypothetical protein
MGQGQTCMKYSDHHMLIGDHVGYALTHVHKIPEKHHQHFIQAGYDADRAKRDMSDHYSHGGVQKRLYVPSCVGQGGCRSRALRGHGITGFFGGGLSQRKMNKHYSHYTDDHALHNLVHHQVHGHMFMQPRRVQSHIFEPHPHGHMHPNHHAHGNIHHHDGHTHLNTKQVNYWKDS